MSCFFDSKFLLNQHLEWFVFHGFPSHKEGPHLLACVNYLFSSFLCVGFFPATYSPSRVQCIRTRLPNTNTLKFVEGTPLERGGCIPKPWNGRRVDAPKRNSHGNVYVMNINMTLFMRMETWTKCDHEILSEIISDLINNQHTFPQH